MIALSNVAREVVIVVQIIGFGGEIGGGVFNPCVVLDRRLIIPDEVVDIIMGIAGRIRDVLASYKADVSKVFGDRLTSAIFFRQQR